MVQMSLNHSTKIGIALQELSQIVSARGHFQLRNKSSGITFECMKVDEEAQIDSLLLGKEDLYQLCFVQEEQSSTILSSRHPVVSTTAISSNKPSSTYRGGPPRGGARQQSAGHSSSSTIAPPLPSSVVPASHYDAPFSKKSKKDHQHQVIIVTFTLVAFNHLTRIEANTENLLKRLMEAVEENVIIVDDVPLAANYSSLDIINAIKNALPPDFASSKFYFAVPGKGSKGSSEKDLSLSKFNSENALPSFADISRMAVKGKTKKSNDVLMLVRHNCHTAASSNMDINKEGFSSSSSTTTNTASPIIIDLGTNDTTVVIEDVVVDSFPDSIEINTQTPPTATFSSLVDPPSPHHVPGNSTLVTTMEDSTTQTTFTVPIGDELNEECSICKEEIFYDEGSPMSNGGTNTTAVLRRRRRAQVFISCGHSLCFSCFMRHLSTSSVAGHRLCPLCRVRMRFNEDEMQYLPTNQRIVGSSTIVDLT